MKRLFLIVVLMCFTSFAFAEMSTSGLTETQKAALIIQAEQMKAEGSGKSVTSVLDVSKQWADAGKGFMVGLGAAAKEAGVAVNEFAVTSVGKITMGIVVWKMLIKDFLAIIVSFCLFTVGLPCAWKVYMFMITDRINYEDRKGIFGRNYRVITSRTTTTGEPFFFITAGYLIANIALISVSVKILPF